MAIVKMKRFRLIALEQDRAALLSRLQRIGCVEIGEAGAKLNDEEWAGLLQRDSASLSDVKSQINLVDRALEALKEYGKVKGGLFAVRPLMTEEEFFDSETLQSSLNIAKSIGENLTAIAQLQVLENRLVALKQSLLPWQSLSVPLSKLSTENVHIVMGVCPSTVDVSQATLALAEAAPLAELIPVSQDRDQHYLLFLCHKSQLEEAELALKNFAFNASRLAETAGGGAKGEINRIDEEIANIDQELVRIAADRKAQEEKIATYSESNFALQHAKDVLAQNFEREGARDRLLTDGTVIFLEGWASQLGLDELEKLMGEYTCAYSLEDPTEEETPPTLLKNGNLVAPMNMVTEMYSLPAYHGGIDPNPLIFPWFAFFYGFMFGDVGYGLIMFLVGFIVTKKYHPKGTIGYMMGLAQICGVTSFVVGALTGGFFGDLIPVVADVFFGKTVVLPCLIAPLEDPMTILFFGIGLGCVQLIMGQIIHIYMGFRDGAAKGGIDAALDVVPWWIVFAGIAGIVLGWGSWLIIVGAASLVLTQGRHKESVIGKIGGGIASLYDITSWLGDVLSYARLMALMLATTVIASVVNMLGTLPANILIFIPIFLFGHSFNMGINIIGTYVHAARLQYLEYFGKFYVDGGIPFAPLSYKTKYVDVVDETGK